MKIVRTITVDAHLWAKVKSKGINISKLVNDKLKEIVETKRRKR